MLSVNNASKTTIRNKESLFIPLSDVSKLIEKIAFIQLHDYIESNNLLSQNQFGFRKGKSIDTLLLYLSSSWRQLLDNKPNPIIGIASLDIKRAFDNINHEFLRSKLLSKFNLLT